MNVLSLFDGMSCGQQALERAGIKVDNYFASEIDKWAIQIAEKNYPKTIHLGDVTKVSKFWTDHKFPKIDLLIGGSPCQSFSNAGNGQAFNDPRGKLFFEYVKLKELLKPKYFLLENVKMKKEHQDIITKYLGVEPIEINSSLVSAQNRKRIYWTNIPNVIQPIDKNILLKDILEDGIVNRDKSYCLDANYFKGGNLKMYFKKSRRQLVFKNNRCLQVGEADIKGYDIIKRVYSKEGKAPSLTTMQGGHREPKVYSGKNSWRKLTPLECERLQTVKDNYTAGVSNSQRYKMLGNGWTIDVIAHILKGLKENKK
tara:strand:+ start:111 stop:1049 length:939 start_codon:yes stop_codon:yes gene_type:complete